MLCTVRGCGAPLQRIDRHYKCQRGHSFDIARSGYVNLLQPQDRRSKNPGDTPDAVASRRRLHDRGVTQPLLEAIAEFTRADPQDTVLDAGCGDGFYLGQLATRTGCRAHGLDISIPAVDAAARRYPRCEWVVANADRFVPYADGTFSLITSITARMNAAEFRRVLHPYGRLLVAVPAPDDLQELRGEGRDRAARTIQTFAAEFRLAEQSRATTHADLDAEAVEQVRHSIYRPLHTGPAVAMRVTLSLDLLLFRPP
jgi:23S rRNA (guanine745-N1)-methyltransferase